MKNQNNSQFEQENNSQQRFEEPVVEQNLNSKGKNGKPRKSLIFCGLLVCAGIAIAAIFGSDLFGGDILHKHSFGEWGIIQESSCSKTGKKERYCDCGEKQEVELQKKEHSFGEAVTTKYSDCIENGEQTRTCIVCSEIFIEVLPKADHTFGSYSVTKEATCKEEGKKVQTCTVCDKTVTEAIPKTAHSYGVATVTKTATCAKEGEKTQTCTVCDKTIKETVPKTSVHTLTVIPAVAATCTRIGLSQGEKCTVCGKVTSAQQTTPTEPHNLEETITKKATSTQSGTRILNCEDCSYSKTESYTLEILTAEEVYELAEKSVGEIVTYKKSGTSLSLGTAFVYSANGQLITNYHVIEGAYSAKITLNGSTYTVSKVVAYNKDIDLAILQINASGLEPVSIQTEDIKGGATVYAVGSSEGYTLSFSTGVIASPSRTFDGVEYIQHEAAISHGNSGGPLFNAYGEVIGINTLTNIEGQNLNFAITCAELDNITYRTPMSFAEFYEKECDPFSLVKDYVIDNGTYDSEDNEYYVLLKKDYSSDYTSTYYFYVYYKVNENELYFSIFADSSSDFLVSFTVDENISGYYDWSYVDGYDYYMSGTITASTYTNNTLLGYSYNNIYYSSLRTSVRKLASSAMDLILLVIESNLYSNTGVNAADLGFVSF